MYILMNPFGSAGDVHPFIGLGLALRDRGHRVEFATTRDSASAFQFASLIRGLGFEVTTFGESFRFDKALDDPNLWHPTKSLQVVADGVHLGTRPIYELIAAKYREGLSLVVGSALSFGARLANEKLGVPLATVHLQPGILRSVYETPVLGNLALPRALPRWIKALCYHQANRIVDRTFGPGLNAYRAELGMPPARKILDHWWHSPDLLLAMFPAWFAPRQPDWPPQLVQAGFPLYDEADDSPPEPELARFLDDGPPPVVFAPGSAMKHAHAFFAESAAACVRGGRRGIFVTRFADQVPQDLPPGVRHFAYVPFSQLLPRAAGLVHHGGIGTAAQGLAAGVPQLVRPLAHDQFDNAARLARLGVGRTLLPRQYRPTAVATALESLIGRPGVAAKCRDLAERIRQDRPMDVACKAIDALADHLPAA